MNRVLDNEDELNARIYQFPTSAIKENGRKINYYDFLTSAKNKECNEALIRIVNRINVEEIDDFIEKVPYIGSIQKNFTKSIFQLDMKRF